MSTDRGKRKKSGGKEVVSIVPCPSYEGGTLGTALDALLEPIGGIERFVRPGQRVLLKPNLLSAKDPSRAVTTHPALVAAVAKLVRRAGGEPFIGDSPGGAIRGIERVWKNTGMEEMAAREGIELINFEASGSVEIASGPYTFYIAKPVIETDVMINLAKLKTHSLTLFTCAIKNIFGVIPGFRKAGLHKLYPKPDGFARMLVELSKLVVPAFTIVDSVLAMEGNGPSSGNPRMVGALIAGTNSTAIDAVAQDLIGFDEGQIDTTRFAAEEGLGPARLEDISVVGGIEKPDGFSLPSNRGIRLIPGALARIVAPLVWLKLVIDPGRCTGCGLCYDSCPVGTIVKENGVCRVVHDGCVQCMCCHELCPENAIDIEMSWLARRFA